MLHVLQPTPGAVLANQLGLVQTIEGFSQSVVVAVAARPDRANCSGLGKSLGVADGQVLDSAVIVVDQPLELLPTAGLDRHLQGVQGQFGA